MTADTLYRLASNTKAFTSMAVALLVDEGKVHWDTPVRTVMPYFKLADAYATDHATIRDLLCHRTGLPAHDWAGGGRELTRRDFVQRLQHLEPSCDMRTKLQYNNWMYMVAGHAVECLTGKTYEQFVRERILGPLGMNASTFSFTRTVRTGNFAECFYLKDGVLKLYEHHEEEDPDTLRPRAPAGGLSSTANELAAWLCLHINKGTYKGEQIVSETALAEMHTPQMVDNWNHHWEELGHSSCGLGWFVWTYRGHKVVIHAGFFGSQILMIPSKRIAVAFMPTLGMESFLYEVLCFNVFDRLLGLDQIPWNERLKADLAEQKEKERHDRAKAISDRREGTSPSHGLSEYCGAYEHPGYGRFLVKAEAGTLYCRFHDNEEQNPLRHYHYDTFELLDDGAPIMKMTFHTDPKGMVSSAGAPMEPVVKDIVFARAVG